MSQRCPCVRKSPHPPRNSPTRTNGTAAFTLRTTLTRNRCTRAAPCASSSLAPGCAGLNTTFKAARQLSDVSFAIYEKNAKSRRHVAGEPLPGLYVRHPEPCVPVEFLAQSTVEQLLQQQRGDLGVCQEVGGRERGGEGRKVWP
jgi:hypothetical protein